MESFIEGRGERCKWAITVSSFFFVLEKWRSRLKMNARIWENLSDHNLILGRNLDGSVGKYSSNAKIQNQTPLLFSRQSFLYIPDIPFPRVWTQIERHIKYLDTKVSIKLVFKNISISFKQHFQFVNLWRQVYLLQL
jgi:hypothetical protein